MSIVGIDIGGTFTDLVGYQAGAIVTSKCATVPADPTAGVAEALRLAGCDVAAMDELLHGSTIAINTVLEQQRGEDRADHDRRISATSMPSGAATGRMPSICSSIGRGRWCRAS